MKQNENTEGKFFRSFTINKNRFVIDRNHDEVAVFSGTIDGSKSQTKLLYVIIKNSKEKEEEYKFGISPKRGLFDFTRSVPIDFKNHKQMWKAGFYKAYARYLNEDSHIVMFEVQVNE